jgi:CRISPR-associated exonuclease Cas4
MSKGEAQFSEDDLLPLSALQHLVFCERQCALIHIDQVWRDNPLTLEGSHRHDRVHEEAPRRELRGDLLIARGLQLRSLELGVSGVADVVEFHRSPGQTLPEEKGSPQGACLAGLTGLWVPFTVEYKRGKPKRDHCDEVQLCAQAICLEEMLEVAVPEGALFYGTTQHRHDVTFSVDLRDETRQAARRLHELLAAGIAPRVPREPKCRGCSLVEVCRPDATGPGRSARRYLANAVRAAASEEVSQP